MIFTLSPQECAARKALHTCQKLEPKPGRSRVVTVLVARDVEYRLAGWCGRCGLGWEERGRGNTAG